MLYSLVANQLKLGFFDVYDTISSYDDTLFKLAVSSDGLGILSGIGASSLSWGNLTDLWRGNSLTKFCFSPSNKKINVILSADYVNSYSQQRTFSFTGLLTNLTTERILYLLPTSAGLFSPFATITNLGDPISSVSATITRLILGNV